MLCQRFAALQQTLADSKNLRWGCQIAFDRCAVMGAAGSRPSEESSLLKAPTIDKELTGRTANVTAMGGRLPLNVKVAHFQGVFFNVAPAALHIFAHERAEHGLGVAGAFQRYP